MARTREVAAESVAAFNARDAERLRSLYARDVVLEAVGGVRLEGADRALEYTTRWQHAFPDPEIGIVAEIVDGDRAALRFVLEVAREDTLAGTPGKLPATGRRVALDGVMLVRVADGRVVEQTLFFDRPQLVGRLGPTRENALSA